MKKSLLSVLVVLAFVCVGFGTVHVRAQIDSTLPTITSVTTTIAPGTYGTGSKIPLTITFSKPIVKVGSFAMNLNTTPLEQCFLGDSAPTTTMSCTYIVKTGDTTGGNPLNMTGLVLTSSIFDTLGNALTNTVPGANISSSSQIVINAPAVPVDTNFCALMNTTFDPTTLSSSDVASIQRFFVSQGYVRLLESTTTVGTMNGVATSTASTTASYDVSGVYDQATMQALSGFQLLNGTAVNGTFDQFTRALMAKLAGCDSNTVTDIRNGNDFAQIIKPNTAVKWGAGQTYSVKYKITNQNKPSLDLFLTTHTDSTTPTSTKIVVGTMKIFAGKNGTFTTSVTVPSYLPGGKYDLGLLVSRTRNDRFKVFADAPITVKNPNAGDLPEIDIATPAGGAVWNKKVDQTITWTNIGRSSVHVWVSLKNLSTGQSVLVSPLSGVLNSNNTYKVSAAKLAALAPGLYSVAIQQVVTSTVIPYLTRGDSDPFSIVDGSLAPAITSIMGDTASSSALMVNHTVTVTGINLNAYSNDINFMLSTSTNASSSTMVLRGITGVAGIGAGTSSSTATSLTFTLPSQVCSLNNRSQCIYFGNGTYQLSVTTPNGTTNPLSFNVAFTQGTSTIPLISTLSPSVGQIGASQTIYGSGFLPTGNVLALNGKALASTTSSDGTSINFTIPSFYYLTNDAVGNGTSTLTVHNVNGVSNGVPFQIGGSASSTAPVIAQMSPLAGVVGTNVQLIGTGFTADNEITFGAGALLHLLSFPVASSTASTSAIQFNVPSVLVSECILKNTCTGSVSFTTPGSYDVTVKNANGVSASSTFSVLSN